MTEKEKFESELLPRLDPLRSLGRKVVSVDLVRSDAPARITSVPKPLENATKTSDIREGRLVLKFHPDDLESGIMMIADSFDRRTLANMEVALERACQALPKSSDNHDVRRHIANRLLDYAKSGDRTLTGLTKAANLAATEIISKT